MRKRRLREWVERQLVYYRAVAETPLPRTRLPAVGGEQWEEARFALFDVTVPVLKVCLDCLDVPHF